MRSSDMNKEHAAARAAMIECQLRPEGIADPAVLAAMGAVPRENFVAAGAEALAYGDRGAPMGDGRWLTPPAALGTMIQALAPVAGERALVVGAGTGYAAAVLAAMGVDPVAIESTPRLAAIAVNNGIGVVDGQIELGHAKTAPFHLILIDGAVEGIPEILIGQLAEGGVTRVVLGTRTGGGFGLASIADFYVPVLPGFDRPKAFVF
jgi:protein-L-isoaspartate(D-aspartate) O-methyltransferase